MKYELLRHKKLKMKAKIAFEAHVSPFQAAQTYGLAASTCGLCVCLSVCLCEDNSKPCDWTCSLKAAL